MRFVPSSLDRAIGGDELAVPFEAIAAVGVAGRSLRHGPFTGGLRRRLLLTLHSGETEAFVVNKVEEVAQRLQPPPAH